MPIVVYMLLALYIVALGYITVYCLMQVHLLYYYSRHHRRHTQEELPTAESNDSLPVVTVQLPIFNELYVVERLVDNIVKFDYPKDKLEIQILDDSTDETVEISRRKVEEYRAQGVDINLIHRIDREGYKAGALKHGLKFAKGEFIAIFDADFLPYPDFLLKTIPHFDDKEVGVVQTRWEHINKNYSLLTRLQAMQLDVHFRVEQQGRRAGNCLLQFNGTAGMWRRTTIEDAGGWEADTLTEDLDLSYRAQLKGWEIVYLEALGSPAELPAEMNGLKSQQFRWTKGGAETARKMLPTIWRSQLSFRKKLHASAHLLSSSVFVSILLMAVLSVPLMFFLDNVSFGGPYGFALFIALIAVSIVYYVANVEALRGQESYLRLLLKFIFLFPVFLSLSMGLSLHNTIAVLQGYRGKKSAFIRTPKFNIMGIRDSFRQRHKYLSRKVGWTTIFEGVLALYFLASVIIGFYVIDHKSFLIYPTMLAFGFGMICYYSIRHLTKIS